MKCVEKDRGMMCGAWRLDQEIGRGAYGVVYLAAGAGGERAAVKVCRREDIGDERYERELRGAKLYRAIPPHEGLVRMRDLVETEWGFYMVMDLAGLVHWRVTDRLKAGKRDMELKANFLEEAQAFTTPDDDSFAEREWQAAALEEALRRIKPDVRPEHYAAFVASAVEGQDTEAVMRLYGLSRDNLYQIRKRLTEKLRETTAVVLAEMNAPDAPDPRT